MYSRRNFIKFSSLSLLNLLWISYNNLNGFEVKRNHKTKKLISNLKKIGPLKKPDSNGIKLPEGFSIKIVAESGKRPLPHKNFLNLEFLFQRFREFVSRKYTKKLNLLRKIFLLDEKSFRSYHW